VLLPGIEVPAPTLSQAQYSVYVGLRPYLLCSEPQPGVSCRDGKMRRKQHLSTRAQSSAAAVDHVEARSRQHPRLNLAGSASRSERPPQRGRHAVNNLSTTHISARCTSSFRWSRRIFRRSVSSTEPDLATGHLASSPNPPAATSISCWFPHSTLFYSRRCQVTTADALAPADVMKEGDRVVVPSAAHTALQTGEPLGAACSSPRSERNGRCAQAVVRSVPLFIGRPSLVSTPLFTLFRPGGSRRGRSRQQRACAPRRRRAAAWPTRAPAGTGPSPCPPVPSLRRSPPTSGRSCSPPPAPSRAASPPPPSTRRPCGRRGSWGASRRSPPSAPGGGTCRRRRASRGRP